VSQYETSMLRHLAAPCSCASTIDCQDRCLVCQKAGLLAIPRHTKIRSARHDVETKHSFIQPVVGSLQAVFDFEAKAKTRPPTTREVTGSTQGLSIALSRVIALGFPSTPDTRYVLQ